MNTSPDGRLIGTVDAAAILGLTRQGVLRRVSRGTLTPLARVGRRAWLFDRGEIEQIAKERAK